MICSSTGAALTVILVLVIGLLNLCCYKNNGILIWGMVACAWGLPETAAYSLSIYSYYQFYYTLEKPILTIFPSRSFHIYLMLFAFLVLLINNLVTAFYCLFRILFPDEKYRFLRKSAKCCPTYTIITLAHILSYVNFKFQHLQWSNLKGSPKLLYVEKLRYLSLSSAIGVIVSIINVVTMVLLIYYVE